MKTISILFAALLCGCSTVSIHDRQRGISFTAIVPAWPWQDSAKTIDHLTLSARGTNFSASLRGISDSEVTNTNSAAMLGEVIGIAIRTAIRP